MPVVPTPSVADLLAAHGRLLEASHELSGIELAVLIEQELRRVGFAEAVLYLTDHEQRRLLPLPPHQDLDPQPIDGSLAGRSYQAEEAVETAAEGSQRLLVPIRDGVERLGVLSLVAGEFDADLIRHCSHAASLIAAMLASKLEYGDALVRLRRTRPMTLAAEFRWSLLPPLNVASPAVSIAAALEPAYEVAGDAFDYALDAQVARIAIFDAMGHGLEAARIGNLAIAAYRHSRRLDLDVATTYARIDEAVAANFGPERFATGQLAVLDTRAGALEFVNAGHPGPLLTRNGRIIMQADRVTSFPFGWADGVKPSVDSMSLEPGDRVIFYTDGLTEARSPDGDVFGEERLLTTIDRACNEQHSPAEALRRLMIEVTEHQGADLRDDATAVMVWWRGPDRLAEV